MILDKQRTPTTINPPSMPGATLALQREVARWFAAGHEVLWIPIYEVAGTRTGIAAEPRSADVRR